jgi:uncharacterized protein (TIGR03382 family)
LLVVAVAISFSGAASGSTYLWSTVNPTYGLLQGTAVFTWLPDPTLSDCGSTTACYSLQIVLSNTSTTQANQSSQVVEGVFFDILASNHQWVSTPTGMQSGYATGGILNSTGNTIVPGSGGTATSICGAGAATQGTSKNPTCTTVASGWENAFSTTGFTVGGVPYSQHFAIGDAGWGLFQGKNVGNPTNGIVPGNGVGISTAANTGLTGKEPYVYGTATFVLYGFKEQNDLILDVVAVYGTAPEAAVAANTSAAPEPGAIVMAAGGLALLAFLQRRRRAVSTSTQ